MITKFLMAIVMAALIFAPNVFAESYPYRAPVNPKVQSFIEGANSDGWTLLGVVDDRIGDACVWLSDPNGNCRGFILDNTDQTYSDYTCEELKKIWDTCVAKFGCVNPPTAK